MVDDENVVLRMELPPVWTTSWASQQVTSAGREKPESDPTSSGALLAQVQLEGTESLAPGGGMINQYRCKIPRKTLDKSRGGCSCRDAADLRKYIVSITCLPCFSFNIGHACLSHQCQVTSYFPNRKQAKEQKLRESEPHHKHNSHNSERRRQFATTPPRC